VAKIRIGRKVKNKKKGAGRNKGKGVRNEKGAIIKGREKGAVGRE